MAESRKQLMEAEITRLADELAELTQDMGRLPWLATFGLLALPAYFIWGAGGAWLVIGCTPPLIATGYYLVSVRCKQVREERAQLLADLSRLAHKPEV